jgi:glucosamine--fructose-6-phosphate aminotransferase (isomerizing)
MLNKGVILMNNYLKDVLDQPHSLRKAFKSYVGSESIQKMEELIKLKFDKIIFTGMGSSHYSCYCASIHLNQHGFVSMVKSASQLLHYEINLVNERTLLVMVSQSGESGEIVSLINKLPKNCPVVAITNNPQSTLGRRGNFTFLLEVADEESVSTRTYLASLILLDLIAKSLTKQLDDGMIQQFEKALGNMEQFLLGYSKILKKLSAFLGFPPYLCLIGRGYAHSTVDSGGLFIKEAVKYPSISIDSGEFRHGPFEMVDSDFTGIVVAPEGLTYDISRKLTLDILDKGGKVLFITNQDPGITHPGLMVIQFPAMDEFMTPILDILPIQLTANHLAESKHLEVGKFRWSSKITSIE